MSDWAVASSSWTVPFSTPTFLPQMRVERAQVLVLALLDEERGAGLEVGHHVDGLLALLRVGEGRHADVVAGAERRDDLVERGVLELDLDAEHLADGLAEVDVHALDRGVVLGEELVRRVGSVGGDDDLLGRLDLLGELGGERRVDPAGRGGRARAAARGVGLGVVFAAAAGRGEQQDGEDDRGQSRGGGAHEKPPRALFEGPPANRPRASGNFSSWCGPEDRGQASFAWCSQELPAGDRADHGPHDRRRSDLLRGPRASGRSAAARRAPPG